MHDLWLNHFLPFLQILSAFVLCSSLILAAQADAEADASAEADPSLLGHPHDHGGSDHNHDHHDDDPRTGRQSSGGSNNDVIVDFSDAYDDPDTGLKCIDKEAIVQTQEREKLLECTHSQINVCHYTYITK